MHCSLYFLMDSIKVHSWILKRDTIILINNLYICNIIRVAHISEYLSL